MSDAPTLTHSEGLRITRRGYPGQHVEILSEDGGATLELTQWVGQKRGMSSSVQLFDPDSLLSVSCFLWVTLDLMEEPVTTGRVWAMRSDFRVPKL